MAQILFSVLSRSCLKQRLSGEEALRREVDALVKERNAARATITGPRTKTAFTLPILWLTKY